MADRNQPVQQQQDNRERTPSVRPKLIVGVAKGSFFSFFTAAGVQIWLDGALGIESKPEGYLASCNRVSAKSLQVIIAVHETHCTADDLELAEPIMETSSAQSSLD